MDNAFHADVPAGLAEFPISAANHDLLQKLVAEGCLPDQAIFEWVATKGEHYPTPAVDKLVVFAHFFSRDFSLPVCSFFRGLLHFYQIQPIHLTPNSIIHFYVDSQFWQFRG